MQIQAVHRGRAERRRAAWLRQQRFVASRRQARTLRVGHRPFRVTLCNPLRPSLKAPKPQEAIDRRLAQLKAAQVGLGRIVASHHRSSAAYQIHERVRWLYL